MKITVETTENIFLKYYRGWSVEFNPRTFLFESKILCLFFCPSVKELELAIDAAITRRGLSDGGEKSPHVKTGEIAPNGPNYENTEVSYLAEVSAREHPEEGQACDCGGTFHSEYCPLRVY